MSTSLTQKCSKGNKETFEPNLRSRWFVYTNYAVDTPISFDDNMIYMAYGDEICPSTQRPHHQGWVYFKNPRYTFALRKRHKCYFKAMFGNIDKNSDYVAKQGSLHEFGTKPSQGERTDLIEAINNVREGVSVDQILLDSPYFFHQYGRTLRAAEDVLNRSKRRDWMTKGYWIHGPTGVGKSHWAYTFDPQLYVKPLDEKWWDDYTGQDTVLIEDFRGEITYGMLLRLIDKYPLQVCRKHRVGAPFLARTVIITSPMTPHEVYHHLAEQDSLDQLTRRVEMVALPLPGAPPGGEGAPGGDPSATA